MHMHEIEIESELNRPIDRFSCGSYPNERSSRSSSCSAWDARDRDMKVVLPPPGADTATAARRATPSRLAVPHRPSFALLDRGSVVRGDRRAGHAGRGGR